MIFNYYGLDWAILIILTVHASLITTKHLKIAFILGIAASLLAVIFNYWINSFAGILFNIVFLLLHIRNLLRIKKLPV